MPCSMRDFTTEIALAVESSQFEGKRRSLLEPDQYGRPRRRIQSIFSGIFDVIALAFQRAARFGCGLLCQVGQTPLKIKPLTERQTGPPRFGCLAGCPAHRATGQRTPIGSVTVPELCLPTQHSGGNPNSQFYFLLFSDPFRDLEGLSDFRNLCSQRLDLLVQECDACLSRL